MSSNTAKTETKLNKWCKHIANNYLPFSDETYNYAIPIGGFSTSCISIGLFMTFIYNLKRDGNYFVNYSMYSFGYLVLAAGCAVDLNYGLRNRDKRQFFFWIFFKAIEMILVLIAVVHNIFVEDIRQIDFIVVGFMLIPIKIGMLIYICKLASSKWNRNVVYQENYYDSPAPDREPTVTVY